jgi:hypothetical protein
MTFLLWGRCLVMLVLAAVAGGLFWAAATGRG